MNATRRSRGAVFVPAGLILCLIFTSLIYLELEQQGDESGPIIEANTSAVPRPSEPSPEAPVFAMPPREAYADVLERPPFSETRRPPPAGSGGTAINQPITATVIGTVLSATGVHALIAHGEPIEVMRVIEGQEIDGWKVKSILQQKVLLTRGGSTVEVKVAGNPAATIRPAIKSPQSAKPAASQSRIAASPPPVPNGTRTAPANPSTAARPVVSEEGVPASDATLSQMTGRALRTNGIRGSSIRGGGARGR